MLRTNAFSFIEIMFEILIGKINIKISCIFLHWLRERVEIGLFVTLVLKVYRIGNFRIIIWDVHQFIGPLSYPFRSLPNNVY